MPKESLPSVAAPWGRPERPRCPGAQSFIRELARWLPSGMGWGGPAGTQTGTWLKSAKHHPTSSLSCLPSRYLGDARLAIATLFPLRTRLSRYNFLTRGF
jgi:hypothetical protein